MNLPEKIKLGHRTIDIRYDPELSPGRDIMSAGNADLGYIIVQPSLPECLQAECIFRGLIHAVASTCGLTHNDKDRSRIGTGILAVIRDNPGLILVSMPDKVRIFGQDWAVILENEHYEYSGKMMRDENAFHINSVYTGNLSWQILWHEILHAIWDKLELELSVEENERDIELISFFLCMLFTQNDFSWVLEESENDS